MNETPKGGAHPRLREQYDAALRDCLTKGGEAALQQAYEIGRLAIGDGLGVLDLVMLHHEVLETALREKNAPEPLVRAVVEAGRLLSESVSPYEMTHRGFQEAVAALRRLNEKLEDEARRIAHALHDEAGQLLVSVHLALEEASGGLPPRAVDRLKGVRRPLNEMEKQLRRLSHELRPTVLDDLGLLPALEFLAQGVGARTGTPIAVEGPRAPRLPAAMEIALYRVVQEALHNACKHARARRVRVRYNVETGVVRCSVEDDGRGFDVAATLNRKGPRGLGLIGMRERIHALGGELGIESTPGRGTKISIALPFGDLNADTTPAR